MSEHTGPWRDSNASIWKFNLPVGDANLIPMPAGATLLHVDVHGVTPCLWAAVDTRARKVGRRIQIAGTGHHLPLGEYVGTFQLHGGALVFHVFDCGEEELIGVTHD